MEHTSQEVAQANVKEIGLYELAERVYLSARRLRLLSEVTKMYVCESKADAEKFWEMSDKEIDQIEQSQKDEGYIIGLEQLLRAIEENIYISRDRLSTTVLKF